MRQYCQAFREVLDDAIDVDRYATLQDQIDTLSPRVNRPLQNATKERWRQQAIAELHAFLMGEDVQLSALAA